MLITIKVKYNFKLLIIIDIPNKIKSKNRIQLRASIPVFIHRN